MFHVWLCARYLDQSATVPMWWANDQVPRRTTLDHMWTAGAQGPLLIRPHVTPGPLPWPKPCSELAGETAGLCNQACLLSSLSLLALIPQKLHFWKTNRAPCQKGLSNLLVISAVFKALQEDAWPQGSQGQVMEWTSSMGLLRHSSAGCLSPCLSAESLLVGPFSTVTHKQA